MVEAIEFAIGQSIYPCGILVCENGKSIVALNSTEIGNTDAQTSRVGKGGVGDQTTEPLRPIAVLIRTRWLMLSAPC